MKGFKSIVKANASKYNFAITIHSIDSVVEKISVIEEFSFSWSRADKSGNLPNFRVKLNSNSQCELYQTFECYGKFTKSKSQYQKKKLTLILNLCGNGMGNKKVLWQHDLEMSDYIRENSKNEVTENTIIKTTDFPKLNNTKLVFTIITWPDTINITDNEKKPKAALEYKPLSKRPSMISSFTSQNSLPKAVDKNSASGTSSTATSTTTGGESNSSTGNTGGSFNEAANKFRTSSVAMPSDSEALIRRASRFTRPGGDVEKLKQESLQMKQEIEELKKEKSKLEKKHEKYKELKKSYEDLQESYELVCKKAGIDVEKSKQDISAADKLVVEDEASKEAKKKIDQLEKEIEDLKLALEKEKKDTEEATMKMKMHQEGVEKLQATVNEKTKMVSDLSAENTQLKKSFRELEHDIDDARLSHKESKATLEAKMQQIKNLENEKKNIELQINTMKEENEKLNGSVKQLKSELEEEKVNLFSFKESKAKTDETINELKKEVQELKNKKQNIENEKLEQGKKLDELKCSLELADEEKEKLKKKIEEQSEKIIHLQVSASSGSNVSGDDMLKKNLEIINQQEQKLSEAEVQISKLNKENENLKSKVNQLEDSLSSFKKEKLDFEVKYNENSIQLKEKDEQYNTLLAKKEEVERNVRNLQQSLSNIQSEKQNAEKQMYSYRKKYEELETELKSLKSEQVMVSSTKDDYVIKIRNLQQTVSELEQQLSDQKLKTLEMERKLSDPSSANSSVDSEVTKRLLKEEQQKNLTLKSQVSDIKKRLQQQMQKHKVLRVLDVDYILKGPSPTKDTSPIKFMSKEFIEIDPVKGLRKSVELVVSYFDQKVKEEEDDDFKSFGDCTKYGDLLQLVNSQLIESLVCIFNHHFISPYWFAKSHFWDMFQEISTLKVSGDAASRFNQAVTTVTTVIDQYLSRNGSTIKPTPQQEKEMKFRSFLFYGINKGDLSSQIKYILSQAEIINRFYTEDAIVRKQDLLQKKVFKYVTVLSKLPIYAPIDMHIELLKIQNIQRHQIREDQLQMEEENHSTPTAED